MAADALPPTDVVTEIGIGVRGARYASGDLVTQPQDLELALSVFGDPIAGDVELEELTADLVGIARLRADARTAAFGRDELDLHLLVDPLDVPAPWPSSHPRSPRPSPASRSAASPS